jgi:glycosyltransferase involved in cell wall biosynthesis
MARYLRDAGHAVTILASGAFGGLPDDDKLGVMRVGDLMSVRPLRRVLRRGELVRPAETGGATTPVQPPNALFTKVFVPDPQIVTWGLTVSLAARRLFAKDDFDCLITTGPPESVHLVGLGLARRCAWLADFRDGWLFEPLREPFPTALQRRLDATLERRVVQRADVVTTVTEPISADFRRRYGVNAVTVPNAYDPALDADVEAAKLPSLPADRQLLVHTGTLSGPRGRDARPVAEALQRLAAEPHVASQIAFVQAGAISPADELLLSSLRQRGLAHTLGVVPRANALALQRRAAVLLLITSAHVSQSTAKLYEYLAARRPILALAEDNEAARIVHDARAGVTVAPHDVDAIADAMRSIAAGEFAPDFAPRNLERHVYPGPADAIAELVETAIERRQRARGR